MKGKVAVYFATPNLGRLRSRLENPSKTLSSDLRSDLTSIVSSTLNEANLQIRAKFIELIKEKEAKGEIKFKTKNHYNQATNLFSGIFDTAFAVDAKTISELEDSDETAEPEDGNESGESEDNANVDPAGEFDTEGPAAEPADKATKDKGKKKKEPASPAADEFDD